MTNDIREKADELLEAAKPLIKYLAENHHPHHTAIVTSGNVELFEGVKYCITNEFIKD